MVFVTAKVLAYTPGTGLGVVAVAGIPGVICSRIQKFLGRKRVGRLGGPPSYSGSAGKACLMHRLTFAEDFWLEQVEGPARLERFFVPPRLRPMGVSGRR